MRRIHCSLHVLCVVFAACVVSGCVTSQYMTLGSMTYPPRPNDYVIEVFLPTDAPVNVHKSVANARPLNELPSYAQEIGRIDTQGAPAAGWVSVINDAKKRARTLGGDAIVIRNWGHHLTGVDSYGNAYHGKNISMVVVRYRS